MGCSTKKKQILGQHRVTFASINKYRITPPVYIHKTQLWTYTVSKYLNNSDLLFTNCVQKNL